MPVCFWAVLFCFIAVFELPDSFFLVFSCTVSFRSIVSPCWASADTYTFTKIRNEQNIMLQIHFNTIIQIFMHIHRILPVCWWLELLPCRLRVDAHVMAREGNTTSLYSDCGSRGFSMNLLVWVARNLTFSGSGWPLPSTLDFAFVQPVESGRLWERVLC